VISDLDLDLDLAFAAAAAGRWQGVEAVGLPYG
jgi:hypothetical protein